MIRKPLDSEIQVFLQTSFDMIVRFVIPRLYNSRLFYGLPKSSVLVAIACGILSTAYIFNPMLEETRRQQRQTLQKIEADLKR